MEIIKLIDKGNKKNWDAYLSDWTILSCLLDPMYKIENARQLQELINLNNWLLTQDWLSLVLLYRINNKRDIKPYKVSKDVIIEPYYNFTNSEIDSLRDEYVDENYTDLRYLFEEELVEHWYSRYVASESNDWWNEYLEREKKVFIDS